jgi:hypothetical protein
MNPEVHGMPSVENAYFRLLRGGVTFVRLSLPKIRNRLGQLPERIVERAIQTRRTVHADGFCHAGPFLRMGLVWERTGANSSGQHEHRNEKCPK